MQPLIVSLIQAIASSLLSLLIIHWILSNITMSFHHWILVRNEENMLSYSSYVDIFILERDPLLFTSYVQSPLYVSFTEVYITVIIGISVVIGFMHVSQGKSLPPFHRKLSRMCCECAKGGHPAAILVALGFSLALAGVCACGLGILNIYQYLWKNHYQRWILEKDALLSPVLNLSEGETPFREYFRKVNCWSEKGIDDIILRYVH